MHAVSRIQQDQQGEYTTGNVGHLHSAYRLGLMTPHIGTVNTVIDGNHSPMALAEDLRLRMSDDNIGRVRVVWRRTIKAQRNRNEEKDRAPESPRHLICVILTSRPKTGLVAVAVTTVTAPQHW